jgi:predicted acetyltransferase
VEFRTIALQEFDAFSTTLANSFGEPRVDDHDLEVDRALIEPERTWAALDEGRIVGCAGTYSLRTVVPGGSAVGTAGVTTVGVLPTHRRRGITTELLGRILRQARERDEPLASLFASQAAIYGRFGFGLATQGLEFDIQLDRVTFAEGVEPAGRVRLLPRDDAVPVMHAIYERFAPTRPGATLHDASTFPWLFSEKKDEPCFYAVHEDDDGTPDAFAVYRTKHKWPKGLPHLELKVRQLIATSPQATTSMWRYLFDVDLVAHVTTSDRPVDEALLWQLEEPRAARPRLFDALYARPVEVAAALSSRGYAGDGRLVIGVTDRFCPWNEGTYEVTVEAGAASCAPTVRDPELTGPVQVLGSVFLGATTWTTLARAGRVEVHDPSALARADSLFATPVAPWAPFFF